MFDKASVALRRDKQIEDAEILAEATVHWLRHTGISDDVNTVHVNTYAMMLGIIPAQQLINISMLSLKNGMNQLKDKPIFYEAENPTKL